MRRSLQPARSQSLRDSLTFLGVCARLYCPLVIVQTFIARITDQRAHSGVLQRSIWRRALLLALQSMLPCILLTQ